MFATRRRFLKGCALSLAAGWTGLTYAEEPRTVQIGLPQNLFRDLPKVTVDALMPTFTKIMAAETGVRGKVQVLSGPDELARQINENKIQLGVFHGFEFAWAQTKYPDLRALCVAVKQSPKLTAQLIVPNDESITKFEDLKGQTLAIPRGTPEHCRLFLSRRTRGIGHRLDKFFGKSSTPPNVAAALDDVASGNVRVTVVDSAAWESYQWMNPGRAAKLRPLLKSEPFPTGVIVYKQGGLPEVELKKFRDGITSAHQRQEGMQLMMLMKLKRFDVVPADYQQSLSEIQKAYPPPIGDEP